MQSLNNPLEIIPPTLIALLVDAGLKSFALLALAATVLFLLRSASAATRHLVWFTAIVGLLLLPVFSIVLPSWQVLPRWIDTKPRGTPAAAPGTAVIDRRNTFSTPVAALPATTSVESLGDVSSVASVAPPPSDTKRFNVTSLGPAVWLIGLLITLAVPVLGAASLWRLSRLSSQITGGKWLQMLRELLGVVRVRRRIALLQSRYRRMPMTWGVLHPRLLLPHEAEEWTEQRRQVVLLHELAHVKRHDYLTNLITQIVCSLYWFNPLVWMAARQMATEREQACDDIVLIHGARPADYAEQILHIASDLPPDRWATYGAIAIARRSSLESRLLAILDVHRNRKGVSRLALTVSILLLAAAVCPLAILRAADEKTSASHKDSRENAAPSEATRRDKSAEFSSLPEKPWTATGLVTDAEGKPLADVEIWVHAGMGSLHRVATANTDHDGRYTVSFGRGVLMAVSDSNLQIANVTAHKVGWFEKNLNRHGTRAGALREVSAEELESYRVPSEKMFLPGRAQIIDFVMVPAARIKGRLLGTGQFSNLSPQEGRKDSKLIAGSKELQQSPLAGWRVWLTGKELPPACSVLATATTDGEGNFIFESVPVGFKWQFQTETHYQQPEPRSPTFKLESVASPFSFEISLELPEKQDALRFLPGSPHPVRLSAEQSALSPQANEYTVRAGDTLASIATTLRQRGFEISPRQLMDANPNANWNRLRVGQRIIIPEGTSNRMRPSQRIGGASLRIFSLKYAEARRVASALKELAPATNVEIDERTNTVIVSGSNEAVAVAAEIIRTTDVSRP